MTKSCLGFCNIQSILEGNAGQDPENCENDFPNIVKCMAGTKIFYYLKTRIYMTVENLL